MKHIYLVTGNAHKLIEWRRLLPADIVIEPVDIDLSEIQSIDPEEIVADKARRAYEQVGKPVVVEDVSAGLEKLGGLPGPFVKFFMKQLGGDALHALAGKDGEKAVVSCTVGYYDGQQLITARADIDGTVVSMRGDHGFGFDGTFIPNGHNKTYAEMEDSEKDGVSHRAKAVELFVQKLEQIY
jgi:non-canonical purine NTP pyrophosphatase (RdgB/HAM1 family)